MIGLNGGLLGVRKVPTTGSASGLWVPNEQSLAKQAGIWPITPETDPSFSSVLLLLHGDGVDSGTTFTDSSSYARSVTADNTSGGASTAVTSTAVKQYGTASVRNNAGTGYHGNYLRVPYSSDYIFGTGDFTVEAWVNCTSPINGNPNESQGIISMGVGGNGSSFSFFFTPNGLLGFDFRTGFSTSTTYTQNGSTNTLNTWIHFAACRSGSDLRLFKNGTQVGATNNVGAASMHSSGTQFIAVGGRMDSWGFSHLIGYIEEARITKNVARYTANFTAPTAAFPDA